MTYQPRRRPLHRRKPKESRRNKPLRAPSVELDAIMCDTQTYKEDVESKPCKFSWLTRLLRRIGL